MNREPGDRSRLVRICRRLGLPLPRHDHSMQRPWCDPIPIPAPCAFCGMPHKKKQIGCPDMKFTGATRV